MKFNHMAQYLSSIWDAHLASPQDSTLPPLSPCLQVPPKLSLPRYWPLSSFLNREQHIFMVHRKDYSCMYVRVPCIGVLGGEKRILDPRTGVTEIYEPPCGCWKSDPSPLQEDHVLLTTELPLFLSSPINIFSYFILL